MTRDIATVLACLVGVPENHVLDGIARDGVAGEKFADHVGSKVVRPYRGECTAVATEWGT
ncbi:hypothetical protein D3C76_1803520 [compost metagenome]